MFAFGPCHSMETKMAGKLLSYTALGASAYFTARALRKRRATDFRDKVVLIVGGSRGLGLVMARQLADEGAKLALAARTQADLDRAEAELRERGAEVITIACDIRHEDQAERAVQTVLAHYGQLDVLINNAGIIQTGPIEHMEREDFDDALATHLWGPLATIRAAVPHMRQRGGRIVNVSSIAGKIAVPHLVPYSASKHALVGLSDGLRAELAKDNIRVTTVCPGLMRTGSPPNVFVKGQHKKEYAWFTISDALPLLSMDGERAAAQIIEAARYGDPALTISTQARMLEMANHVVPSLTANFMAFFNRLLPGPTGSEGDRLRTGWESQSPLAPSVLTALSDKETVENNELHGSEPMHQQAHEAGV